MFTGIIEELGTIREIESNRIVVECVTVINDAKLGDSIAVNGVCLTITNLLKDGFIADLSPETINITALKYLKKGSLVNLERAMILNGRFGGHIISGHIDGLAKFKEIHKNNNFYCLKFELRPEEEKYVVKKGSIAINGISLTIANIKNNDIELAIIPHTYENTSLKKMIIGDFVNIEVDITAKYIEKILSSSNNNSRISLEFLRENGF